MIEPEIKAIIEEYEAIQDEAMMHLGRCGETTKNLIDRIEKCEAKLKAIGETVNNGI